MDSNGKQKNKSMRKGITIRGHDHPLIYRKQKKKGSTYECNGCQQAGLGPCYSCNDGCNLHYHPRCSELLSAESSGSSSAAPVGNHHPFSTGNLVLKEGAPRKVRPCVVCGKKVQMLRYKWRHKKAHGSRNPYWRLYQHLIQRAFHPLCASLPAKIEEPREHGLVLQLMERIRGECLICKGDAKGWAYNSSAGNYGYHVGCMKKKIIQSWQQDKASRNGGKKRKVIIYVKKALQVVLEIVKVAFKLIIEALFGSPLADLADIIGELFDFTYDNLPSA